jgi:hypothetical protein
MEMKKTDSELIRSKKNSYLEGFDVILRKSTSQKEFETSFRTLSHSIVEAVEGGMATFQEYRSAYPEQCRMRNVPATVLNANVFVRLKHVEGLQYGEINGRKKRSYIEAFGHKLFVKKLDERFKPFNIETDTIERYNSQQSDDECDTLPITYLGYQVDEQYRHITGVYAIHMENGALSWKSDLSLLASENAPEERRIIVESGFAENEVTVSIKEKNKKQAR